MPWITAIAIPHLLRAVAVAGVDVATLRVPPELTADVRYEDRVALATFVDLWERAVAATGRRDLPVVASRYAEPDERSLIGFVVANQPRLGDGIVQFQRFYPTVSDGYRWQIVDDGDHVRVQANPPGPVHRLGWQCYLEYEAIDIVQIAARLTEGRARPIAVRHLHAAPPPEVVDAIAGALGVAPAFGQDACEVVFAAAVRDLAVPAAKPALAAVVEAQLETMLEAVTRGAPVTARTRAAIGDLLGRGTCSVDELARALFMSRRSLERSLADEGTSAGALIEDERKQRALAWLPALSVEEVASRLGYSDARAFARAFKRWTGLAPSEARARSITGGRR